MLRPSLILRFSGTANEPLKASISCLPQVSKTNCSSPRAGKSVRRETRTAQGDEKDDAYPGREDSHGALILSGNTGVERLPQSCRGPRRDAHAGQLAVATPGRCRSHTRVGVGARSTQSGGIQDIKLPLTPITVVVPRFGLTRASGRGGLLQPDVLVVGDPFWPMRAIEPMLLLADIGSGGERFGRGVTHCHSPIRHTAGDGCGYSPRNRTSTPGARRDGLVPRTGSRDVHVAGHKPVRADLALAFQHDALLHAPVAMRWNHAARAHAHEARVRAGTVVAVQLADLHERGRSGSTLLPRAERAGAFGRLLVGLLQNAAAHAFALRGTELCGLHAAGQRFLHALRQIAIVGSGLQSGGRLTWPPALRAAERVNDAGGS